MLTFADVLIVSAIALIVGIIISWIINKYGKNDYETIVKIRNILPGTDCGECGMSCDEFAYSVINKKVKVSGCISGGKEVTNRISFVLNLKVENEKMVARVMCNGKKDYCGEKFEYSGEQNCYEAIKVFDGHKMCKYGCLGHGNCAIECEFNAIEIVEGIALIIEEKCYACGKCVQYCPRNLIEMVERSKRVSVLCRTKDNENDAKKNCVVGCIGCERCLKACKEKAIIIESKLSRIDYLKCTNCEECVKVCPTSTIKLIK